VSETPGKLERRARALLRAYPAEYRHGRAEEIIGTLLEAAQPGRSYPAAREAWSLIAGGRHARADRNRRPGVKVNVRLALLLGISIYVSFSAAAPWLWVISYRGDGWTLLLDMNPLALAAALGPWLGRRAATTALAIPAGALAAYGYLSGSRSTAAIIALAEFLIIMAALVVLSGGPVRLPRSWLWLPCAFPLVVAVGRLLSAWRVGAPVSLADDLMLGAPSLLAVVVVCWLVTDARPAFALCIAALLEAVATILMDLAFNNPLMPGQLGFFLSQLEFFLLELAIVLPVLLPAAWLLLRRQKTPGAHPFPEP
jgi:hypothetical protein